MSKYRFEQIAINSKEKKKPTEKDRFTYIGLEHLDTGSLNVTRFGSDVAPIGEKLIMRKDDVLFGKRRAYQKKVAIAPFDGIFSAHGMVLRPKEDVVDKNFFPLFISSDYFLDAAIKISVGSLSPTINWRDLKDLEFEMPDLHTQKKLAEALWAINNTIESYKKLIFATDELVKSQFIENIQPLLDIRETVPLDRLIEPDRPITYGILKPGIETHDGVPVVKVKDIRNERIDESDLLRTSTEIDHQYRRSRLRNGDLLISIRGTVGRIAEVPKTLKNANITQDTARLSIKADYNKTFVRGVLESAPIQRDMEKNIRGVAVKGINIGYLRQLGIPLCKRNVQDTLAQIYVQADKSKFAALSCLKHRLPLRFQHLTDPSRQREFSQQLSQENYNG